MTYVFKKSVLPLCLLASFTAASASDSLRLKVDLDTPLMLEQASFSPGSGVLRAQSSLSITDSKVACYDADGKRADVELADAVSPLVVTIDGNSYELAGDVIYSSLPGGGLQVDSMHGVLTCKASGETDLLLRFDDERYGPPIRLGHAVSYSAASGPSDLVSRDVLICNGEQRAAPRGDLDLRLRPWLPRLAELVADPDVDPSGSLWQNAGFGSLGDVFGDNTVHYGSGNVLTVETHEGFSCFSFPFSDTQSVQAGLQDDDWFQSCVDPDGIFCDSFQLDPSKSGLAVVMERVDVSSRAELEYAYPGQIVSVRFRAINLGLVPVTNGLIRTLPMIEVCDASEICYPIEPYNPDTNFDIPVLELGAQSEWRSPVIEFTIPAGALPGDQFRLVAASFNDGAAGVGPERGRTQLVITVADPYP